MLLRKEWERLVELRTRPTTRRKGRCFPGFSSWVYELGFPTGIPVRKIVSHTEKLESEQVSARTSSNWVWGKLIEIKCQPFPKQKYLTASYTQNYFVIFIYFPEPNLQFKKWLELNARRVETQWIQSQCMECFLLYWVFSSPHLHSQCSPAVFTWQCAHSCIFIRHSGRANHVLILFMIISNTFKNELQYI